MKTKNPFSINTHDVQKLIDRENETSTMLNNISSGTNTLIISKNGVGKTTLALDVLASLKKKKFISIYIDFREIISCDQPVRALYNSMRSILHDNKENNSVESLEDLELRFDELINSTPSNKKKIVIVFDNFRIVENSQIEKILSNILLSHNLVSIYLSCFNDVIIENTETMMLENIQDDIFKKSIFKQFVKSKKTITKKSLDTIFKITEGDTYSVKYICHRLWELNFKKISQQRTRDTIDNLLLELDYSFSMIINILSPYQVKLLKAIAIEGIATKITSRDFIDKYRLNAPSSVKTAINSMIDKEIIYKANNEYQLHNLLFELYLKTSRI